MAKGGRMIVNKSRRGIRRFNGDGDESDDDEYIAEEDEIESESYDESLASSSDSDEDPPEFGENLAEFSGSDHNFDEEEADFEFDDSEFEPEEEEEVRLKRSKKGQKKLGKKQKKSRKQVSDEEEDFDFSKQVPNWDEEEEFDLDDNPVEFKTKKKRSKRRKKSDLESDYELEAEDDLDINPVECKKKKSRSKRNKSDEESDYEQEAEDYSDEDLDEDEDFSPDIDEEEEEFLSIRKRKLVPNKEKKNPIKNKKSRVSRRKKTSLTKNKKETKNRRKRIRTKRKKNSLKEPVTKRRRRTNFIKDDEEEEELLDDYFLDDDDDEFLIESRKRSSKYRKRKPGSDSETSEFEFLTSEESESEPEFKIQTQIRPKRRKKLNSKSDFSNSSDSDFIIQEPDTALKPVRKRKRETLKGKEVEKDELEDSGKKVCGICLNEEQKRTTPGVLDCCAHFFCFACIIEWSKVESRCPVCKRRFETITKASSSDSDDLGFGAPNKVVKVPKRDQVYQPSEEDLRGMLDPYENVVCMECQQGGDDNLMLLCDICDSSAHTYCVGLGHSVPEGNWYCDCCRSSNTPFHPSNVPFTPSNIPFPPSNTPFQFQPPNIPFPPSSVPSQPENVPVVNSDVDLSAAGAGAGASSSGLEIDLNAPPVEEEGSQVGAPSPSAGGAATLSGRRAIRQRIRILLSNTRAMQIVVRQNGEGVGASNREHLPPAGGSRFGPLDPQRAKERVRHIVKSQLRNLCVNSPLEYDAFKSVARGATYSVLAACGIRVENRNVVCGSVQPPQNCGHEIRNHEGTSLLRDVCSACFSLFVRDVVARVLNMPS